MSTQAHPRLCERFRPHAAAAGGITSTVQFQDGPTSASEPLESQCPSLDGRTGKPQEVAVVGLCGLGSHLQPRNVGWHRCALHVSHVARLCDVRWVSRFDRVLTPDNRQQTRHDGGDTARASAKQAEVAPAAAAGMWNARACSTSYKIQRYLTRIWGHG